MRKGLSRWLARLPPVHNEGAATAEFAVVLPSVIAITGVLLTLTRVVAVSRIAKVPQRHPRVNWWFLMMNPQHNRLP